MRRFHAALAAAPPPGFRASWTWVWEAPPAWAPGAFLDWYVLDDDWAALGALSAAAVALPEHAAPARMAAAGAAGVYRLVRGEASPAIGPGWADEPCDEPVVWRRQLVLGPGPQYLVGRHGVLRGRVLRAG